MTIFSDNMKKYRVKKSLTQEQVAEKLCVNSQTVSRWECGTTMPDVLLLPEIAKLYEITIDDLFKTSNYAYKSYAERLASIYERTRSVDDFYAAEVEFRKLIKSGQMEIWNKWSYANLLDEMREYCTEQALKWYDEIIQEGEQSEPYVYRRARSLRAGLLIDIGKGTKILETQEKIVNANPDNHKEVGFLMELYCRMKNYDKVLELLEKYSAGDICDWSIYYYAAEANRHIGNYEKAIVLYKKSGDKGVYFHSEIEGIADCYNAMGEKQLAYEKYMEMASFCKKEGYDEDALFYEELAEKCVCNNL